MLLMVTAPYSGTHWLSWVLQDSQVNFRSAHSFAFYVNQIADEDRLILCVRNPWRSVHSAVNRNHQDLITVDPEDLANDPGLVDAVGAVEIQVRRMERLVELHQRGAFVIQVDVRRGREYDDLMAFCEATGTLDGRTRCEGRQVHASVPYIELQDTPDLSPEIVTRIESLCSYWGYPTARPVAVTPTRPLELSRATLHQPMVDRKAKQSLDLYRQT